MTPYEDLTYELSDGRVNKLRLFENGYVDTNDGEYTAVCETGGRACADQYISDNYPEEIEFNGKIYLLYLDGHSTWADGTTVICADGGLDCLTEYLFYNYYDVVQMYVGPFIWTFEVFSYGNTSVYNDDWDMICETGGIPCLQDWGN